MSLFYCKVLLLLLLVLLLLSFIFLLSFDHVKLKAYLEESIFRLFGQHCLPLPNKFDWIGKPEKVSMFCFCFCPFYLCMLVAFLTYLIQATTFLLLTQFLSLCGIIKLYSGTWVQWYSGQWKYKSEVVLWILTRIFIKRFLHFMLHSQNFCPRIFLDTQYNLLMLQLKSRSTLPLR